MTQTTHVTCSNCSGKNRIPTQRLGDKPKCGKCKSAIFNGKPIDLSAANVAVVLHHNELPVLVDCWAPWCGPCQSFAPTFSQAAAQLEPKLRFAKLNTEQEQSIAGRWNIRSIPTLIIFVAGKEQARLAGAVTLEQLNNWLAQQGVLS